MTLSQKDLNAVIVDRAYANTNNASDPFFKIIEDGGDVLHLETNSEECLVILFFGKYYAGRYCG